MGTLQSKPPLERDGKRRLQEIAVLPMKFQDMPTAAESMRKAFLEDALMKYFLAADTAPYQDERGKLINMIDWEGAMRQNRMLVIEGGMSCMKYGTPGNQTNLPSVNYLTESVGRLRPEQCAKRWQNFGVKVHELVSTAFGEKVKDMIEIQALGTDSDAQGRGYASALVEYVLKEGDANGQDVWLITTDAYGFYERLGFVIVSTGQIGEDDPTWDGAPITLRIMHRAAKALGLSPAPIPSGPKSS